MRALAGSRGRVSWSSGPASNRALMAMRRCRSGKRSAIISAFHRGSEPPPVTHFISAYASSLTVSLEDLPLSGLDDLTRGLNKLLCRCARLGCGCGKITMRVWNVKVELWLKVFPD